MGFWRCFLISRFQANSSLSGSIRSPILLDRTKKMEAATRIVVSFNSNSLRLHRSHRGTTVFWLHTLCKSIDLVQGVNCTSSFQDPRGSQPPQEGYGTWLRSGLFLRWKQCTVGNEDANEVDMIIFSPTISLERNLEIPVQRRNWRQALADPFCLFVVVLEDLFEQVDAAIAKVYIILRSVEHVSHPLRLYQTALIRYRGSSNMPTPEPPVRPSIL